MAQRLKPMRGQGVEGRNEIKHRATGRRRRMVMRVLGGVRAKALTFVAVGRLWGNSVLVVVRRLGWKRDVGWRGARWRE